MTQDPYENDLALSANSGDDGDEFDGLEAPKSSSKTPMIALICLVLLAGAAFLVYQLFLTGDDEFVPPPAPPAVVAEAPQAPQPDMPSAPEQQQAVDAGAPPVADPNAVAPPVPGTDPANTDPNAVTAEAVPAPPVSNDPAAAPVPSSAPDATTTAATPSEAVQATPPTDNASAPPAAQAEAAPVAAPEATQEVAQASAQAPEPAPPAAAALPTPPAEQLKPIDPATGATADVQPEPLPVPAAASPSDQKIAKTINEVNEILGADAQNAVAVTKSENPQTPEITKKVDANISKQVEVTPRARQVIIVKKNYSAQSSQAIVAAGDRVLQAGQYGGAVEIFDSQLAKNPSDPLALAGKAEALQRSGRTAEAMEVYDRLLDLNPRDLEALTNYLGLLQKQDPNQALSRLQELARQYPENAAVNGQLGMTYANMMDTPNALRAFQKAAALDATNATYPFNLAVLYDRLGTSDKARDQYLRALRLVRDYPNRASGVPIEAIRNRLASMPF